MARTSARGASRSRRKPRRVQVGTAGISATSRRRSSNIKNRVGNIRDNVLGPVSGDGLSEREGDGEDIQSESTNQEAQAEYQEEEELTYTIFPRPRMSEAIRAKCCECSANYDDGHYDCKVNQCPLYSRMPYRKLIPNFSWIFGKYREHHTNKAAKSGISHEEYISLCVKSYLTKIQSSKISKITLSQMIRAKCFDCCSDYNSGSTEKGRIECGFHTKGMRDCPLYYWTPYRTAKPNYDWMFDLNYTRKHRTIINATGMTRNDYIRRVLVEGEQL